MATQRQRNAAKSRTPGTRVDLKALRQRYTEDDTVPETLIQCTIECKRNRDAFWRYHDRLMVMNHIISIPLVILSSATGVTSVAQVSSESGQTEAAVTPLSIAVAVCGVVSAILAAFQKYFRYGERAEQCKHMAKSYARVARKIESQMVLIESGATTVSSELFRNFMAEVQKDMDTMLEEVDEMPPELIKRLRATGSGVDIDPVQPGIQEDARTPLLSQQYLQDITVETPLTAEDPVVITVPNDVAKEIKHLAKSVYTQLGGVPAAPEANAGASQPAAAPVAEASAYESTATANDTTATANGSAPGPASEPTG